MLRHIWFSFQITTFLEENFLSTGSFFQTLGKFNQNASQKESVLTAVLIISVMLALSVTVYVIVTPKEGEKFTEIYVLGPRGMAEEYPIKLLEKVLL